MKTLSALCLASAMALALVACGSEKQGTTSSGSAAAHGEEKLAELTVDEVEKRIAKNDGKFFVYDNNQRAMYEDGHVPGAKHLPIDDIKESDLPADKSAELLFYCSNEK